jgi:hypothetical protein
MDVRAIAPGFAERPPPAHSGAFPHRFAIGEMNAAASSSSLCEAWGGGPPKVVEGPRGRAEDAAATLADVTSES